jgi:DNA-binding transcriptional LysR family regulator
MVLDFRCGERIFVIMSMTRNHHSAPFDSRLLSGLGVLAAVVEAGSFVRAAAVLGLTQSGVSRAVARLEDRVGVRLLDRSSRAVALTDEGRRFYARAGPLLTELEEAATDAAGASAVVRGRLRVMVDPMFARLDVAPRLVAFLAAHPELSIDLTVRHRFGDLVAEGFDAAVRFGEPEPSALVARKLTDTRVVTVAAPSYIARRGRPARPQDLIEHECIMFRDPANDRPFAWEFWRKGKLVAVPAAGRLMLNDAGMLLAACHAGHGVAQMLELGAEGVREGKLIELFPAWNEERFPLYVFYPSRRLPAAKVRAFVDFVVALTKAP